MHVSDAKIIRVLIVDDHALVRAALRMLIESHPGVAVVGEAAGFDDALIATSQQQPDVVLLDLDLGGVNGVDLLPQLHTAAPKMHVVVLTGMRDVEMHRRAVRLGAAGLVLKEKAAEVLIQAITKVHAGEIWLDSMLVAGVLSEMTRPKFRQPTDPEAIKIATLTAREREVIELVGEGLNSQMIADRLCISKATVRHHLTSIFAKLSVNDRLQLAIYAYRHGLACVTLPSCPPRS
jgi:two-component system, NarL family, nitrate/nitrite response regulator NarL